MSKRPRDDTPHTAADVALQVLWRWAVPSVVVSAWTATTMRADAAATLDGVVDAGPLQFRTPRGTVLEAQPLLGSRDAITMAVRRAHQLARATGNRLTELLPPLAMCLAAAVSEAMSGSPHWQHTFRLLVAPVPPHTLAAQALGPTTLLLYRETEETTAAAAPIHAALVWQVLFALEAESGIRFLHFSARNIHVQRVAPDSELYDKTWVYERGDEEYWAIPAAVHGNQWLKLAHLEDAVETSAPLPAVRDFFGPALVDTWPRGFDNAGVHDMMRVSGPLPADMMVVGRGRSTRQRPPKMPRLAACTVCGDTRTVWREQETARLFCGRTCQAVAHGIFFAHSSLVAWPPSTGAT